MPDSSRPGAARSPLARPIRGAARGRRSCRDRGARSAAGARADHAEPPTARHEHRHLGGVACGPTPMRSPAATSRRSPKPRSSTTQITQNEAVVADLEAQRDRARDAARDRAVIAYQQSGSRLAAMVDGGDVLDAARRARIIDQVESARPEHLRPAPEGDATTSSSSDTMLESHARSPRRCAGHVADPGRRDRRQARRGRTSRGRPARAALRPPRQPRPPPRRARPLPTAPAPAASPPRQPRRRPRHRARRSRPRRHPRPTTRARRGRTRITTIRSSPASVNARAAGNYGAVSPSGRVPRRVPVRAGDVERHRQPRADAPS